MSDFYVFVLDKNGNRIKGQPRKGFDNYVACRNWIERNNITEYSLEQADGLS